MAARRAAGQTLEPRALPDIPPQFASKFTNRDLQMLYAVERTGGNMTAAARDEGVTVSFVSHAIRRLASRGHPDALTFRKFPLAVA